MRLPLEDLQQTTERVFANGAEALRGTTIVITGGTGFLGRWLVETFCAFCDIGGLDARMVVLSRNVERFRRVATHLAGHAALSIIEGDLHALANGTVACAPAHCDFVIHAATEPASRLTAEPRLIVDTMSGTRDALEFAVRSGARRFVYLSSGAIYGRQPSELVRVEEDYSGAPDVTTPASAYGETKRVGELLCASYARTRGIEAVTARGFSIIGPHIPLDPKFAAGEFLADAVDGRPITLHGDGTPLRSYLYAADFAAWLWAILLRGAPGRAYNVGSETEVSIAELARAAAALNDPPLPVMIAGTSETGQHADRYVPSTARARRELGVEQTVDWRVALRRTYEWLRAERQVRVAFGSTQ